MAGVIPNRMAFFWAGSRMSWVRWMTLYSFCKLNPDWDVRLYVADGVTRVRPWNTTEVHDYEIYRGPDYLDRLIGELPLTVHEWKPPVKDATPIHASDLFQWQWLARGGWYADMDILFVNPMANIAEATDKADIVLCNSRGHGNIGFLAGSEGCEFWKDVGVKAIRRYKPTDYFCCGVKCVYEVLGVDPGAEFPGADAVAMLPMQYRDLRTVRLEDTTVYPWPYNQTHKIWSKLYRMPSTCIGIHWFGGQTFSQIFNCGAMTERNFREFDNTFAYYAAKLYDGT